MAKSKRKSSRRPVDPATMLRAQQAKRLGLISKRAKTVKGKLSRGVIKKTEVLTGQGLLSSFIKVNGKMTRVTTPTNVPIKVPKGLLETAKLQGYETVGKSIIVPADEKSRVTRTVRQGKLAGIRRVPTGQIEAIPLKSIGVKNFDDLISRLRANDLEKNIKAPDERYNFNYFGNPSIDGEGFLTDRELLNYLMRYSQVDPESDAEDVTREEAFFNFELVRYGPDVVWSRDKSVYAYETGMVPHPSSQRKPRKRKSRKMVKKVVSVEEAREKNRIAMAKKRAKWSPEKKKEDNRKRTERRRKKAALNGL